MQRPDHQGGAVIRAVLAEPPVRRVVKSLVRLLPFSPRVKSLWDATERPQYLFGVLHAAHQARREGHSQVSVIEFGVAEGYGLRVLERHAAAVERATGIAVKVYGFDTGAGLPELSGDHRDHPDVWGPGDYRMGDIPLAPGTRLVLGDVAMTAWETELDAPIGFMAMDLDLYSSTVAALRILLRSDRSAPKLTRVGLYFDDTEAEYNHRWAGELLAIDEFNATSKDVKIDHWRGIQSGRPFPEADWLRAMYLAHDLPAIGATRLTRAPVKMR